VWGPFAAESAAANPVEVRRLRVDVEFSSDYSYEAYALGEKGPAFAEYEQAWTTATQVATELIAWIRAERQQRWLGPSGHVPSRIGRSALFDLDANERFGVGIEEALPLHSVSGSQVLDATALRGMVQHIAEGSSPPDAETLLADGFYFAIHDETPHPARGLLLVAIAAELKIKSTLREKCPQHVAPLVDFILERGRVQYLLAGPFKGAVGRSLLHENKPLYDEIHHLFTLRGRFVHHGKQPSADEARTAIRAAEELFAWLDDV
jgi:hypothetical protein